MLKTFLQRFRKFIQVPVYTWHLIFYMAFNDLYLRSYILRFIVTNRDIFVPVSDLPNINCNRNRFEESASEWESHNQNRLLLLTVATLTLENWVKSTIGTDEGDFWEPYKYFHIVRIYILVAHLTLCPVEFLLLPFHIFYGSEAPCLQSEIHFCVLMLFFLLLAQNTLKCFSELLFSLACHWTNWRIQIFMRAWVTRALYLQ